LGFRCLIPFIHDLMGFESRKRSFDIFASFQLFNSAGKLSRKVNFSSIAATAVVLDRSCICNEAQPAVVDKFISCSFESKNHVNGYGSWFPCRGFCKRLISNVLIASWLTQIESGHQKSSQAAEPDSFSFKFCFMLPRSTLLLHCLCILISLGTALAFSVWSGFRPSFWWASPRKPI